MVNYKDFDEFESYGVDKITKSFAYVSKMIFN